MSREMRTPSKIFCAIFFAVVKSLYTFFAAFLKGPLKQKCRKKCRENADAYFVEYSRTFVKKIKENIVYVAFRFFGFFPTRP